MYFLSMEVIIVHRLACSSLWLFSYSSYYMEVILWLVVDDESLNNFYLLLIVVSLFNNIAAPYIAETSTSPNCFYYFINNVPSITSYYYDVCILYRKCVLQKIKTFLTYEPFFHYNYQCFFSSFDLTVFGYVFFF
jgi:hypothetical protein